MVTLCKPAEFCSMQQIMLSVGHGLVDYRSSMHASRAERKGYLHDGAMACFRRDLVQRGDLVIVVSDIRPPNEDVVRSVQIRHVP